MEQRERGLVQPLIKTCVRPTRFQKPARFSSISSRFAERDVPISASPSSFSAFRPAFLPSSSTPLRFIQPSSDCSHIVRTPLVSSTHTHTFSCSLLTKYSRDCQGMGEIAKWMFVPDGENSFRVSLCYFYEHLANPYPLLSFDFYFFVVSCIIFRWIYTYRSYFLIACIESGSYIYT